MRLSQLESGHALHHRLMLKIMRLATGVEPPDVIRTMLYRPKLFGKTYSRIVHHAMHESEHWQPGECELFAAFISRQNQCPF